MSRAWHQRFEAERIGGPPGELVAARPYIVPPALLLPLDRVRDSQVRGGVARPLLLVAREEGRVVVVIAPAEDEWVDVALELAADIEEAGALRCAQPLVAVARVEVRVELAQAQREMSR